LRRAGLGFRRAAAGRGLRRAGRSTGVSVGLGIVRVLLTFVGALMLFGGLAVIVGGGPGAFAGLWLVVTGGILLIGVALERLRYRSEQADRVGAPPGPGGGESLDAPMEPRFRRTDEFFEDPTSRRRMRVWLDATTGERRYRAEG
jgi:hypothetical protein